MGEVFFFHLAVKCSCK